MDNTQTHFVPGLVLSEAAANVPTSAFLVCHSQRCKLQADTRAESKKVTKREKEKSGILTTLGFPLKGMVYIFSKIRALLRPRIIFFLNVLEGNHKPLQQTVKDVTAQQLSPKLNNRLLYSVVMFASRAYF